MKEEWSTYCTKSLIELQKIKPKWAYGENIEKAHYLKDQLIEGHKLFLINPYSLIIHADFQEVDLENLYTGKKDSPNDTRISNILWRWDNNKFVDPPTIHICKTRHYSLAFSDGRHRAKLSHFLKYDLIPIVVHKDDVYEFKNLKELESIEY